MKKWTSFAFIFIILAGILSFFGIFNPITSVSASINREFVNFTLTGYQGYYPYTYFDSLEQTTYTNKEVFYINQQGERVNTYRALKNKVSSIVSTKHSQGSVDIVMSSSMQRLIGTGKYFVYASAGLLSLKDGDRSKIEICLKVGDKVVTATSNKVYSGGDYSPDWVETDKIYIDNPNEVIEFSFRNKEASSIFDPAKFYIFEPTISFGYELEEIYCNLEDGIVSQGQLLKLEAETALSKIEQGGALLSYYKNYHKIEWEILQGDEIASISGNYLNVTGEEGIIKLRAKCRASSESEEYLYSETITYKIEGDLKSVNLISNFPDGAILGGGGVYYPYENETNIIVAVKPGYKFSRFIDEDGKSINYEITGSDSYKAVIDVNETRNIKVELIKEIKVDEIVIEDKYYDKTDGATITEIIVNGILEEHDIAIKKNVIAKYSSILAGEDIFMILSGGISISGADSYMYEFNSDLPETYGKILKREIVVNAEFTEKEYGYGDGVINYSVEGMLDGEHLTGQLSREEGEEVGEYEITLGTLNNDNYSIDLKSNIFEIKKRTISVTQINIEDRIYDKTLNIYPEQLEIITDVNVVDPENTRIVFEGKYEEVIGTGILVNFTIKIEGENTEFYLIKIIPQEVRARILPRTITVTANSQSKIYGEEDPTLTYVFNQEDLLDGDELSGELSRTEGEEIGLYRILIGTLALENYEILFENADLTITKKQVTIIANEITKIYGDADPALTFYSTDPTLELDKIGLILNRGAGEDVGVYNIEIGSQMNINYQIEFTSAEFIIEKRQVKINILVQEKDYDGNTNALVFYNIPNLVSGDEFSINITALFDDKNVGERGVTYFYNGVEIINFDEEFFEELFAESNLSNYIAEFGEISYMSRINRKDILLKVDESTVLSKVYGSSDPEIKYVAEGLVGEEELVGKLLRIIGENVGSYSINQGEITNENNSNYNIIFENDKVFVIVAKEIEIGVEDKEIIYGDDEGEIKYIVSPELEDIELTDFLKGSLTREQGFVAGEYQYLIGSLSLADLYKNNYKLIFVGGTLRINKRNINIEVLNFEKTYGDSDPIYGSSNYIIKSGTLINPEDLFFIRELGENVGEYTVTPQLIDSYEVEFIAGKLTINPASITIKANNIQKVYGQEDPQLKYSITDGILMFEDKFIDIFTGELIREMGEDTGQYIITQGNLEINSNYTLSFIEGELTIIKKEITVYANQIKMFLDDEIVPLLTYEVDGLINGDVLSGELNVGEIDGLGSYEILKGSLNSENYNINFVGANLIIVKRTLIVIVNDVFKEFNGKEPDATDLTYSLEGDLVPGDEETIKVTLYKEKGSSIGEYLVSAFVEDSEKYDIIIEEGCYKIIKREITIKADDITITYGDSNPEMTYSIIAGEMVEGNELNVKLYTNTQSYRAGEYTISATITNAENYEVNFHCGKLTVNKRLVRIIIGNFSKTYGDYDPSFEYFIDEKTPLHNSDSLQGSIIRESGEVVGKYKLVCSLYNANYEIIINDAFLIINKKDAILVASALDKIYDKTDVAYLRMPTLSGIIEGDDVTFDYKINELARFENSEVGDDKKIVVYGGELIGQDAKNYNLIRPINLTANITEAIVEDETKEIAIYATDNNTKLKKGTTLSATELDIEEISFGDSKSVVAGYNLSLIYNEDSLQSHGSLNVKINLGQQEYFNVQLYKVNSDGSMDIVKSVYKDGVIQFDTEELGTYVVIADNDKWINYALIGLSTAFLIMLGWIVFVKEKKKHREKLAKKE